jgi:hypothetical protein
MSESVNENLDSHILVVTVTHSDSLTVVDRW